MPAPMTPTEIRRRVESSLPWREASAAAEAIRAAHKVARDASPDVVDRLDGATRIVITGAGSSLYVAQMAAEAMAKLSLAEQFAHQRNHHHRMPEIAAAHFVSSPLSRARETMRIIRQSLGLAEDDLQAVRLEPVRSGSKAEDL